MSPILLDMELELAESVAMVRIGRANIHVVVSNPTDEPIVLSKNVPLVSVEPVSAVIPLMAAEPSKLEKHLRRAEVSSVMTTPQHTTSHNHHSVPSVSCCDGG